MTWATSPAAARGPGCRRTGRAGRGRGDPDGASEARSAALGVEPEQDLGDGQADQLGVGEARWSAGTLPDAERDDHDESRVGVAPTSSRRPRPVGYGLLPL